VVHLYGIYDGSPIFIFIHHPRSDRVKKSKNLQRLSTLVNELGDRDKQLKRDMELFEEFFDTFPIPVTIWSITKTKNVVSQHGNGFICSEAHSLEDLFSCPTIKGESIKKHERALKGEKVSYFVHTDDSVYFVRLIPRLNEKNEIAGVSGISWDVTVNAVLLSCLENISDMTKGRRGMYKDIHKLSTRGISASKLRELLSEQER
jgi:hypothetical protein